jgi:hypothetical protein
VRSTMKAVTLTATMAHNQVRSPDSTVLTRSTVRAHRCGVIRRGREGRSACRGMHRSSGVSADRPRRQPTGLHAPTRATGRVPLIDAAGSGCHGSARSPRRSPARGVERRGVEWPCSVKCARRHDRGGGPK